MAVAGVGTADLMQVIGSLSIHRGYYAARDPRGYYADRRGKAAMSTCIERSRPSKTTASGRAG